MNANPSHEYRLVQVFGRESFSSLFDHTINSFPKFFPPERESAESINKDNVSDDVHISDDVDVSDNVNVSDDVHISDDVHVSDNVDVSDDVHISDDVEVSDNVDVSDDLVSDVDAMCTGVTETVFELITEVLNTDDNDNDNENDCNSNGNNSNRLASTVGKVLAEQVPSMSSDVTTTFSATLDDADGHLSSDRSFRSVFRTTACLKMT